MFPLSPVPVDGRACCAVMLLMPRNCFHSHLYRQMVVPAATRMRLMPRICYFHSHLYQHTVELTAARMRLLPRNCLYTHLHRQMVVHAATRMRLMPRNCFHSHLYWQMVVPAATRMRLMPRILSVYTARGAASYRASRPGEDGMKNKIRVMNRTHYIYQRIKLTEGKKGN